IDNLTGVYQAHNAGFFGKGIKIGVIDTGIYYLHPALGGCFKQDKEGKPCKVAFGAGKTPRPAYHYRSKRTSDSHGTHTTGIIAADTRLITDPAFRPLKDFIGVAPEATMGMYRVFGCNGASSEDILAKAIFQALEDKVDIISFSIGTPGTYDNSVVATAIRHVVNAGTYFFGAAGNDGGAGFGVGGEPADVPEAISVASVDNTDRNTAGTPSSFTSLGLGDDLLISPTIAGIGGHVYSTVSENVVQLDGLTSAYQDFSGTSMSVPGVAGAAALYLSVKGRDWVFNNGGMDKLRRALTSSAKPVHIFGRDLLSSVWEQGSGLVSIFDAITARHETSPAWFALNDTIRTKPSYNLTISNHGSEAVTYTLTNVGAALATGKSPDSDQLLNIPIYSANYAVRICNERHFPACDLFSVLTCPPLPSTHFLVSDRPFCSVRTT
ncbi:peptidase S8/S53 domain-containing protein, partial [Blyttiomyces helicus]